MVEVEEGSTFLITSEYLHAVDTISTPEHVEFTLLKKVSSAGGFFIVKNSTGVQNDLWSFREDGRVERRVFQWTQQNILDNELFYRSLISHHNKVVMDVHEFYVEDDADFPNRSPPNSFYLTIVPVDKSSPKLFPGSSLYVSLQNIALKINMLIIITHEFEKKTTKKKP